MSMAKNTLRAAASVVLVVSIVFWLSKGGDRGWTKTSSPVRIMEPVTGIEGVEYRKTFIPGVDFLAMAFLISGILAAASYFISNKTNKSL